MTVLTSRALAAALLCVSLVGGCKKEAPPPPAPAASAEDAGRVTPKTTPDEMEAFLFETGEKDLRGAKQALARGENPLHLCAAVTNALPKLQKSEVDRVKEYVADATTSCGFEIPVAWADRLVKKMNAVRETRPAEVFFVECVEVEMALEAVSEERRQDPRAVELLRQHAALCEE